MNPCAGKISLKQILEFAFDQPIYEPIKCYVGEIKWSEAVDKKDLFFSIPFESLSENDLALHISLVDLAQYITIVVNWENRNKK